MKQRITFTTLLLLLTSIFTFAQVSFRAVTDAKEVTLNGYFEIQFTLENGRGEGFTPPSFQGLRIMGGPNQSMSTSIVNGVVSSTTSYGYVLQPTRMGKVTVGRASVKVDGKTYNTDLLTIKVVESKERPENEGGEGTEEVFLKAEIEAEEVYIGQQVPLNYRIYTLKNVNSYNILEESSYQGFYAEDLRRFNAGIIREDIGGLQYTTKVLKRMALFPQQTGLLRIEPMRMQMGIAKGSARDPRDFFFTPDVFRINVASAPVDLNVKSLPENAPPSFTGAVGQYTFSSSINNKRITTDDALEIRVNIAGNGDVKRVQPPVIDLGAAFDVYEPKVVEENISEMDGEIRSRRIYEYLALPKVAGNYDFQLEFTYFSPETGTYETIQSENYYLTVAQGINTPVDNNPAPIVEDDDIHYIKSVTNLQPKGTAFFASPTFWGLTTLPFLLFFGVIIFKQVKKSKDNIDPILLKNKRAQKIAQSHLSSAKTHMEAGNSRAFYDGVSKAMLSYVNDKLNIPNSELTKDNVIVRLQSLNVPQAQIERFMQVFNTCEMALYARQDSTTEMKSTYENAIDVLVRIEEAIGK